MGLETVGLGFLLPTGLGVDGYPAGLGRLTRMIGANSSHRRLRLLICVRNVQVIRLREE